MNINILIIILFITSLTSFIYKSDENYSSLSKRDYLTASTWRIKEVVINGNIVVKEDSLLGSEAINATYTFNKNGTYAIYSDGETDDGTWFLTADETKLILDKDTEFEDVLTIVKLNPASFNYITMGTNDDNENLQAEIRLVPKKK